MTKNVSLSFVVCFPRKRSLTERKSPLLGAQTVSLPFSARLLETTTHTTPSRTPLSLSHSLSLRKSSSFSSSFREREKETYFFGLLVALSEPISFPYIFFHFKKSCIRSCTRCSLTLSRTRTHTNSAKSMRRWYATAFLCAHSSERVVVRATPELMIFERKKAKLFPLARNERNETRAICFRGEKSDARKRKNCQKQSERKKCSNDEISTPHSKVTVKKKRSRETR